MFGGSKVGDPKVISIWSANKFNKSVRKDKIVDASVNHKGTVGSKRAKKVNRSAKTSTACDRFACKIDNRRSASLEGRGKRSS